MACRDPGKPWRTYFVDGKYTPAAPPVIVHYPNISQDGIWLAGYRETVPVRLSQPVPAAMITAVEINTNATGGGGDNWDLENVQVALLGGGPARWLVDGGSGPYRFTGARVPFVINAP
ncbi:MAG: hypothetical protein ACKVZ0_23115 [Gemmatimonadales bacterium]